MRARNLLIGVALASIAILPAHAAVTGHVCAPAAHPGGEWRGAGGSIANHRNQPAETVLNASTVGNVEAAWVFRTNGAGTLQNTPVIADGCMYLATSTGWVMAVNADDGKLVWSTELPGNAAGSLVGGVITGSPAVAGGVVYVATSERHHPRVVALDQQTGTIKWSIEVLDPAKRPGGDPNRSYENTVVSAPVVWNGLLFQGIMGDEATANARGGYAILDLADTPELNANPASRLIVQDWTITDAEWAAGYRGASIWCTAAIDAATGYAYACGGNPASKQIEARNANALLKIDMDRTRLTFGKIVDAYKGETDQYYPGLDRQPACDTVPTTVVWSPTCVQLDLDFGASPVLFTDSLGRTLLGDLQKSGVFHAVYADTMQRAWTTIVATPGVSFNAASPAVDTAPGANGGMVYVNGSPPGHMVALTKAFGRYRWVAPLSIGPTHFQPASVANGVAYSMNNTGDLTAVDTALGVIALRRNLLLDTGTWSGDLSSQGVSIARNTIYAASSSFVVAYR